MSSSFSRKLKWIGAFVFVLMVVGIAGAMPARALSNYGPDPGDFEDGWGDDQFGFAVTSPSYSQAQIVQTWVSVYFKNNVGTKTIMIGDGDLCTDRIGTAPYEGNNYTDRAGRTISGQQEYEGRGWIWWPGDRVTRYTVRSGSYTSPAVYGVYSDSWSCYRNSKALSFPGSSMAFDSNTGYYKVTFTAQFLPGFAESRNHFHIWATDSDAVIGYDSTLNSTSFSLFRLYPRSGTRTYNLRFAPDCTLTAPTRVSAYWYDDDNGDESIQPNLLYIQLRKYRASDGAYMGTVPLTFNNLSWQFSGPEQNSYYVFSGSANEARMNFTAEPGMRYIWRWNDVYYPNGLQFKLPYDSIYWLTGCQRPTANLRPSSTVDKPTMTYPDTATFTHYLNVSSFSSASPVTYTIQRYRNGTPIGAVQNGTYTPTGNGQFTLQTNLFNSTAADAGGRICERLTLISGGIISNNPSEACTTVVSRPFMKVTRNDVWAGGRFDYSNNLCTAQSPRNSRVSSWVSNGGGAMVQYGLFALGAITEFGSGNQAGSSNLTFANTPSQGNLGAPTRCMDNYYSTIGTGGGSSWPGSINSIPGNAGKRKYTSGSLTISGGTVAAGTQAVLLVNGDVRITGNINYANGYTSRNSIPVLWIIATGNIYIQENVTNLSGLYVAQGTSSNPGRIHTCVRTGQTTTYNPMQATTCNNGLDVAGALIADKIFWQRTRGTAAPGQNYAEGINFDPGLYLNSPFSQSTNDQIDTQDIKELPPIY